MGLAPKADTQSTLMGLGMTRSFKPAISSTFVRGRRLLVIWRKPNSQNDRPTMPFSSSLACSLRPTGPSTMVSASLALANKKGKSSTVISLATLAKMPLLSTTISKVPPCTADTLAWSLPSTPPGNRLILILPPDLALTNSAYFSMPITTGWPLGFWVANLMVRSRTSWALAMPSAPKATAATTVLIQSRFISVSKVVSNSTRKMWRGKGVPASPHQGIQ